jgi:DNA-binding NarL/FixJ family response regulator
LRKHLLNDHRAAAPLERQRATVLVIADEFPAYCVSRVLEGTLFRIVAVASVEEAIACNERLSASLVILALVGDQRRDQESALRLLLACTSHRTAMIAIGASSDSRAVQAALEYADDYVSATVLKAELPGRARAALRRRQELMKRPTTSLGSPSPHTPSVTSCPAEVSGTSASTGTPRTLSPRTAAVQARRPIGLQNASLPISEPRQGVEQRPKKPDNRM